MSAALEQAYQNQKMVGKFPGCVLRVACKLNAVDVNVHPAKTEVKFTSERKLFDAVYYAVKETLEAEQGHPQAELKPKVPPKQDQVTPNQTFFRTMTAEEYRRTGQVLHSKRQSPAPPREDPFETAVRQRRQEVRPSELVRIPEAAEPIVVSAVEDRALVEQPVDNCVEKSVETVENPLYNPGVSQVEPVQTRKPEPIRLGQTPAPAPAEQPEETPDTAAWRLAGELFDTYVIVEQGDTAYLIDKHAAHERMNFDRMRAADWKPMSQLLLTPQVLHLAPEECGVLMEQMGLLEQFGFAVESFGGDEVLVREAPNDLSADQIEPALEEIASKLLLTGTADPAAVRDEVLHTMACKAAIKGGWKNDRAELEVVARAVMSGQVKYCPHGRPVAIELSRQQLEKQFKRS